MPSGFHSGLFRLVFQFFGDDMVVVGWGNPVLFSESKSIYRRIEIHLETRNSVY
jgi:hypothetical protein